MNSLLRKFFLAAAVLVAVPSFAGNRNIDITKTGARAVPGKDNAAAIQKAIDKVNAAGGGTVTVPAGDFLTGPVELKSGVELHLEMGARLVGIADKAAYKKAHLVVDGEVSPFSSLIYAYRQSNIAVTGLFFNTEFIRKI